MMNADIWDLDGFATIAYSLSTYTFISRVTLLGVLPRSLVFTSYKIERDGRYPKKYKTK